MEESRIIVIGRPGFTIDDLLLTLETVRKNMAVTTEFQRRTRYKVPWEKLKGRLDHQMTAYLLTALTDGLRFASKGAAEEYADLAFELLKKAVKDPELMKRTRAMRDLDDLADIYGYVQDVYAPALTEKYKDYWLDQVEVRPDGTIWNPLSRTTWIPELEAWGHEDGLVELVPKHPRPRQAAG